MTTFQINEHNDENLQVFFLLNSKKNISIQLIHSLIQTSYRLPFTIFYQTNAAKIHDLQKITGSIISRTKIDRMTSTNKILLGTLDCKL